MTDTLTTAADTVQAAASAAGSSGDPLFLTIMKAVSMYAIPLVLLAVPVIGVIKKLKVYEVFTEGAKEGFETAVKIIPYLVAMLVAIGMFRASGAMDFLVSVLSPVTNLIGMPAEVLPAALMRPLSGSGTLGIVTDLINHHGADSLIGRISSTMFGSTETTFYVLAVYFGSVGLSKSRHAVIAGLIGDVVGLLNVNAQVAVPNAHVGDETVGGDGVVQILRDDDDEHRQHQHRQHGDIQAFAGDHILDAEEDIGAEQFVHTQAETPPPARFFLRNPKADGFRRGNFAKPPQHAVHIRANCQEHQQHADNPQ